MKITRQHRREARLLWNAVSENGAPDEARLRAAVRSLRQISGRDAEAVLICFAQRLAIYIRSTRVNVVSADALTDEQRAKLGGLTAAGGALQIETEFSVEPAVIGGLRVERGYSVMDMTIARQLERLRAALLKR